MSIIVVKPKTKREKDFLTRLLKKMNIDISVIEEPIPNYETRKAMEDALRTEGTRVTNADELFAELGI